MRSDSQLIGAIDAGSNAIRTGIARIVAPGKWTVLYKERLPIRLGTGAFGDTPIPETVVNRAITAFRQIASTFDSLGVRHVKAIATSALREATNGQAVCDKIYDKTGIEIEIIDGVQEATFASNAVMEKLQDVALHPDFVFDIGGGSLEVVHFKDKHIDFATSIPLGTVRLMDNANIADYITPDQLKALHGLIAQTLEEHLPASLTLKDPTIAGCGGNAKVFRWIAPLDPLCGIHRVNLDGINSRILPMAAMTVDDRINRYSVRRDRAEVMVVAAIIISQLAKKLRFNNYLVPGVGVREGIFQSFVTE